ncbi:MAG: signal peptidase I [Armatimonas sp.]
MPEKPPLTDQLANLSPVIIVAVILGFTLLRVFLARRKEPWALRIAEMSDTVSFVLALGFLLLKPFVAQAFYIPSESMESTLLKGDRIMVNKFQYRFQEPQRGNVVVFAAPPEATKDGPEADYIKRLIGLPGETIEVKRGRILLDDEEVDPTAQGYPGLHFYIKTKLELDWKLNSVKLFSDHVLIDGTRSVSPTELAARLGKPGAKVKIIPGQTLINGKALSEPYTREDPDYDRIDRCGPDELYMLGDNRNLSADSHEWGTLKRWRVIGHAFGVFWPPARIGAIR